MLHLSGAELGIGLFEFVPDGFHDGGEGCDPDASADQHANLVVKHILAGGPKRSVHAHPEDRRNEITHLKKKMCKAFFSHLWRSLWCTTRLCVGAGSFFRKLLF